MKLPTQFNLTSTFSMGWRWMLPTWTRIGIADLILLTLSETRSLPWQRILLPKIGEGNLVITAAMPKRRHDRECKPFGLGSARDTGMPT